MYLARYLWVAAGSLRVPVVIYFGIDSTANFVCIMGTAVVPVLRYTSSSMIVEQPIVVFVQADLLVSILASRSYIY